MWILPSSILPGQQIDQWKMQKSVDDYFQEVIDNSQIPGFTVAIVKDEKILFARGYGVETIGAPKLMTSETVCAIGSLTKSFTAAAIMQLEEKGVLDLDQPVVRYLPWFRTANKTESDAITIRMILSNTSGLMAQLTSNAHNDSPGALEAFVRSLQETHLMRAPGTAYQYSNAGFAVAGLIVEKISGMPYAEYIEKHILSPLDMFRSTTDPEDFFEMKSINGHHNGLEQALPASPTMPLIAMAPAGSIMRSTARDISNYLIALLNGGRFGNQSILSASSIETMWTPQVSFVGLSVDDGGDGEDYQYGLGWMLSEIDGRKIIHHAGSTGTMSSMTMIEKDERLAVTMLFNLDLTLIDKYKHPTMFSIINNALNTILAVPRSEFGLPRVPDPSLNNYILEEDQKTSYCGNYLMETGGYSWMFNSALIQINQNNAKELEAKAILGNKTIEYFELDFITPVNAVSRNIGLPHNIHFKVSPKGRVLGMSLKGSYFRKVVTTSFERFVTLHSYDSSFAFMVSDSWQSEWKDELLMGNNGECSFIAGWETPKGIISNKLSEHETLLKGPWLKFNRSSYFWAQQSSNTQRDKEDLQHLLLRTRIRDRQFLFLYTTTQGHFTAKDYEAINKVLDSIRFP